MARFSSLLKGFLLLSASAAALGVAGTGTAAADAVTSGYTLSSIINVGPLTAFDISFVDPVTGTYYFADRTSASVQIINPTTFSVIGQATGFVGNTGNNSTSGPDGVLVVDNGTSATLYAGDGGSTLRSFNVTNPTTPIAGGTVNTGGGALRLDEMAYSPSGGGFLLAANNANSPAYANLISTTPALAPSLVQGGILVPGQTAASGGLEQSVWDPNTGTWFVSVPSFNGTDAGGVAQYNLDGTPATVSTFNFSAMGISACGSSGLALGSNGNLLVGCSGGSPVVLNPTTGTATQLTTAGGADELWYNPTNNTFAVTGALANGDRVIDVLDGSTYALDQEINLTDMGFGTGNAHSVAVDPFNGEIFVPIPGGGTNTACAAGCVAAFDLVPEPPSFPVLLAGLFLLLGLHLRSRRQSNSVG